MAVHEPNEPIDILRKTLIVVLLVAALLLLHQFAVPSPDFDPRGLLSLGFIVLAAYTIGELAEGVRLPHISGYLVGGLLFGPSMAHILQGVLPIRLPPPLGDGILSEAVIGQLGMLDTLALALIALTAGGELKLDALRRGLVQIAGVLAGQAVTIAFGVVAFTWVIVQVLPHSLPAFAGLGGSTAVLAMGAVLASISFSTSPAATIAVINSTRSKGPVASTVLSAVVLKDLLVVIAFSAATTVAVGVTGAPGATTFAESLGHIAASMVLGVVVGGATHLYLRFIGAELLLFLVGIIYTTAFVVEAVHGEPALTFIVAGIVVGNFSDRGETLIHEVERLSLPVYVVFFTLAGAKLHLDQLWQMLIPALGLVCVRTAALYAGVRTGATLTGAAPTVVRFGWMGFVSQAGLAILLATDARGTYPNRVGEELFSLVLGAVALNEMLGPVLLQWALGFAGETGGGAATAEERTEKAPERDEIEKWELPEDTQEAWGLAVPTGSEALDQALDDLASDLQGLARDQTWVPLADLRRDSESWLRQLRREFLRVARRAGVRTGEPAEVAAALRNDVGELGERWRDLVLDLQARAPRADRWSPLELAEAVHTHVSSLQETFTAPVPEQVLARREEPYWMAARRALVRLRHRFAPTQRDVNLRDLALYHLSGTVPGRLEGLAALLVSAEIHLAGRTTALFAHLAQSFEQVARLAEGGAPEAEVHARIAAVRDAVDAEFQLAFEELENIARDGTSRAVKVLGHALQRLREDALVIGTLDLPYRKRRFSRVFRDRNRGLALLTTGLRQARQGVAARYAQLALELELVGLEGRVNDAVRSQGQLLVRRLKGRGPKQLRLVEQSVGEWLERSRELLDGSRGAPMVSAALRKDSEPLVHRIRDARANVDQLQAELADEAWVSGLLETLLRHAQSLTEFYTVPTVRPVTGEWALPPPVPTTEVPFRDVVSGFVESRVTRDLLDLTADLSARVTEMVATLDEVERVVAFNVELACTELDVIDDDEPLAPETAEIVRAMVLGAIGRSHNRLARLSEAAEAAAEGTEDRVHAAVIGQFESLRAMILDGRILEIRTLWLRDAGLGRQLARRAEQWRGWLPEARDRATKLVRGALGEDRLLAVRASLGLPELVEDRALRAALAPPEPPVAVPVVYRRLFSDQPLEAGDLLAGRQAELERLRGALARGGRFRSAAVVGLDVQGAVALVNAAVRGAGLEGPVRLEATGPLTIEDVDRFLARVDEQQDQAILIDEPWWLFRRQPGGFAPLERLVDGILRDGGRNGWILMSDPAVFRFASRVSGLAEAMGAVVELDALTVDELERALLSRHAMSGYEVLFDADDDVGWQLEQVLLRGEDRERRRRHAWFRTLHGASAGVLQDALRLWMAAITEVDDEQETVHIGAVPRPPLTRLSQLPEDSLLTLLETSSQGWITAGGHARLFRADAGRSRAHLAQLVHLGLLVAEGPKERAGEAPDEGPILRVAPHLRGALNRVLTKRGWT